MNLVSTLSAWQKTGSEYSLPKFSSQSFHADMHPGNVFVDVSDPKNPKYAAVDFGIVGSLDEKDRISCQKLQCIL